MSDTNRHWGKGANRSLSRRSFVVAGIVSIALASAATATGKSAPKVTARDVTITTPDGSAEAALFYPSSGKGPWPAVLLWPDTGLRPVFRDMGRRLAAAGYVVLVPNSFYRSIKAAQAEAAANLPPAEAYKMVVSFRATAGDDGIGRDTIAYMAFLDARKQTARGRKAGVMGYSVGGAYAFRSAAAMPDRFGAVASFHGLGVATARPNSAHLLVPKTKAAYFVAIARNDDAREPDDKDDIAKAFHDANLPGTVEVFPADHGWCLPGSPAYDEAAATRAWSELVSFYKATLD